MARQHLFERTHLVKGALPGGQADRQRPLHLGVGKVGHCEVIGDQCDAVVTDRHLGVDQHDGIVDDVGTIAGVGVREEHHLDAAREILQLR